MYGRGEIILQWPVTTILSCHACNCNFKVTNLHKFVNLYQQGLHSSCSEYVYFTIL